MKAGKKIPIAKKENSNIVMTNHRSITITATLGKTYEHVLKMKMGSNQQSDSNLDLQKSYVHRWQLCVLQRTLQTPSRRRCPSLLSTNPIHRIT